MCFDLIIYLMNELDGAKVELEELRECGTLEEQLEAALEIKDLENRLRQARLDEYGDNND